MITIVRQLRKQLPGIVALVLVAGLFVASGLRESSAAETEELASTYGFEPMSIAARRSPSRVGCDTVLRGMAVVLAVMGVRPM